MVFWVSKRNQETQGQEKVKDHLVEVVGGEMEEVRDEKTGNVVERRFVQARRKEGPRRGERIREVVHESHLGALMRQDYELCGCSVVHTRTVNENPTLINM